MALEGKRPSQIDSQAFTLIEMLVVLGVIVLLVALIVPAATTVLQGTDLTRAGQNVSDQIGLAKQQAESHNTLIEVRFYQFADPSVPGETAGSPATGKYRAMQLFQIASTGTAIPLGKTVVLPTNVIIDSGVPNSTASLSLIIGQAQASAVPSLSTSQTYAIPRAGTNYNSVAFRFRPDGSTNLPLTNASTGSEQFWFLTLHSLVSGDHLTTPPKNFYTIQIDPNNGNLSFFRP